MKTELCYPLVSPKPLYHAGTLDRQHKGEGSLEGAGLSVSQHPEAWIRIAKLGGVPIYEMQKPSARFLDFYALQEEHKQEITKWGLTEGYVQEIPVYLLTYDTFDDNDDPITLSTAFSDVTKMQEEKESLEGDEIECVLTAHEGLLPLTRLREETKNPHAHVSQSFSLLTTLFVEHVLGIDGIWWQEELNIYAYSAPRGVIVPSKVYSWTWKMAEDRGVGVYAE